METNLLNNFEEGRFKLVVRSKEEYSEFLNMLNSCSNVRWRTSRGRNMVTSEEGLYGWGDGRREEVTLLVLKDADNNRRLTWWLNNEGVKDGEVGEDGFPSIPLTQVLPILRDEMLERLANKPESLLFELECILENEFCTLDPAYIRCMDIIDRLRDILEV